MKPIGPTRGLCPFTLLVLLLVAVGCTGSKADRELTALQMEFETSEFDITQSYSIGDLLTVGASGQLTLHTTLCIFASGR